MAELSLVAMLKRKKRKYAKLEINKECLSWPATVTETLALTWLQCTLVDKQVRLALCYLYREEQFPLIEGTVSRCHCPAKHL